MALENFLMSFQHYFTPVIHAFITCVVISLMTITETIPF